MLRREIVSGSTAVYLALLVLLCPLRWLIAGGVAAVVHELGHSLAVRCCGGKLSGCRLSIFGAYLNAAHLMHLGLLENILLDQDLQYLS